MPVVVFPLAVASYTYCGFFGDPRAGGARLHQGVDLCAPTGTPVLAVDNGGVTFGTDPMGGIIAKVYADDGATYYYAHLQKTEGPSGRRVEPGEVIGYVDKTGNAALTVPHLHFEAHPGSGAAVDPKPMLDLAQRFASPPRGALRALSTGQAIMVGVGVLSLATLVAMAIRDRGPVRWIASRAR